MVVGEEGEEAVSLVYGLVWLLAGCVLLTLCLSLACGVLDVTVVLLCTELEVLLVSWSSAAQCLLLARDCGHVFV